MIMRDEVQCRISMRALLAVCCLALVALPTLGRAAAPAVARHVALAAADDKYWKTEVSGSEALARATEGIYVIAAAGGIEVVKGDGRKVRIEATVKARQDTIDEEEVTDVFEDHVEVSLKDGVLTIADAHRDQEEHENNPWQVSFTISIPRALSVHAVTGAGSVSVSHAGGSVNLVSGAGSVTLDTPDANLDSIEATSGAGNVSLSVAQVDGSVSASSGAGNVRVKLHDGGAGEGMILSSGTGDVMLEIPDDVSADLKMSAGIGSIEVKPADLARIKRSFLGATGTARLDGGGPKHLLTTGTGSIKVRVR